MVENTVGKKDFSLIGAAAFYLHGHLLYGTRQAGLKFWRESSRRWINFSSDKDTGCVKERKV